MTNLIRHILYLFVLFLLIPAHPKAQVSVEEVGNFIEVKNELIGVLLPKAELFNPDVPERTPAPIHSMIYADGTLGNNVPHYLHSPTLALSMNVEILTNTPDSATIQISYTFDKPELEKNGTVYEAPGPGYYRVTVSVVADEAAVMVLEESDFEVEWELPAADGMNPDKGRYIGHHSTSVANGYDPEGNVYEKLDRTGWHATVDLAYSERREFEPLPRWSPWVANSGWHWQVYNSTSSDDANTFGVFDGRPSRLLGAQASHVQVYTEPNGVEDLYALHPENGGSIIFYKSGNEVTAQYLNDDGSLAETQSMGSGDYNSSAYLRDDVIHFLTTSPVNGEFLKKRTATTDLGDFPLSFDAQIDDPHLYGAANDSHDFILFQGTRNGESGLLLYSAPANSTNFTFSDILSSANTFRSANRPDMKTLSNGDILVAYAENGFTQSFSLIENGATTFSTLPAQPLGGGNTFGMAINESTGQLFWIDGTGGANLADINGTTVADISSTSVTAFLNHQGNAPNRRTIASDSEGNTMAYHEGEFFYFESASQTWVKLSGTDWEGISPAIVHVHNDEFIIFGRKDGQLKRWTWENQNNPALSHEYAGTERPSAGVKVSHLRISASNDYFPDIRFEWGLFAGKKGDLPAPDVVNPIAHTMNRMSGLANRLEEYENTPAEFSEAFHNGAIYISPQGIETLINRVKRDEDFYQEMVAIDPGFRPVMDAWRDETPTKTNELYNQLMTYADDLKTAFTTGDGIYSFYHLYVTGANEFRRRGALATGLLADDKLTDDQRENLEKKAALFARILWDNDYVPFFLEHGLNLGTPNMLPQFRGYRWFFALLLTPDPEFNDRAMAIASELNNEFDEQLYISGAPQGTPHYLQPALENLIFPALQLRNQGISDEFASNEKIRRFADFVLHLQTPPSVRFSGNRKLVCFGDGTEESAAIFGLMATGFKDVDEALANRLMHAYRNGPARATDFGFVTLALDHDLASSERLTYGSGHFPGYLSTFRTATGEADESASWFINGDWFFDHRNDDRGSFSAYALGAPLAFASGSFYSPYIQGGHMKNIVVPRSIFEEWNNQFNIPFLLPRKETWSRSEVLNFEAFNKNGRSKARFFGEFGNWTREVFHFAPRSSLPIIVMRDSMSSGNQFIWNMNFATDGEVLTPSFTFDPPARKWDYIDGPFEQPAASGEIGLPFGGFHRYVFQGQNWPLHPHGGIDIEFYTASINEASSTISEWAHTFIPVIEANEYQETNGQPFEERYQTLRIISDKEFFTMIVPFAKGQRPAGMEVNRSDDTLTVTADDFEFWTDLNAMTYQDAERTVLSIFNENPIEFADAVIEGGGMELEILPLAIFARLHGETGVRQVTLPPGDWEITRPSDDAVFNPTSGKWELNFEKTDSLSNSYSGNYIEFMFTKKVRVAPKVILEGSWDESQGFMHDQLRTGGLLPTLEPYSDLGYQTFWGGDERAEADAFSNDDNDAIVDWVFLELRDENEPTLVVSTRAALLQRDGDIVDIDGHSEVEFYAVTEGNYYLAVRHRNHMDIMTAEPINLSQTSIEVDFSSTAVQTWNENSRKNISGALWAMHSGDLDNSGNIDSTDRINAWNQRGLAKYHVEDVNLDGVVDTLDKEMIWGNRNVFGKLP